MTTPTARLLTSLSLATTLAACPAPVEDAPGWRGSSGTIALSSDDTKLFVADADHRSLFFLDSKTGAKLDSVDLGAAPAEVLADTSGGAFVVVRGSDEVVHVTSAAEIDRRGGVGLEPAGLAFSPDHKRIYVTNQASRSVSVLDAATLDRVREDLPAGAAPRSVVTSQDGLVHVGDFLSGEVRSINPDTGETLATVLLEYPETPSCSGPNQRIGTQVAALAVGPYDGRLYAAHVQSRTDVFAADQNGWNTWNPSAPLNQAVSPALGTITLDTHALLAEPAEFTRNCWGDGCVTDADYPPPLLATDATCGPPPGMDAPSAIVIDQAGDWIYVADHNSNAVAIVSATRRSGSDFRVPERGLFDVISVGARPTGLALGHDGLRLFAHNAFDHSVSVVRAGADGRLIEELRVAYASSPLDPAVDRGRRLFYSAVDTRMTEPTLGGLSCASCHPDGGTDGLTWSFRDTDGTVRARNTPALWGVSRTSPYHWDGAVQSLPAFAQAMIPQMGGDGLNGRELADLVAFMDTIQPPRTAPIDVTAGRDLFRGVAGCATCHAGELFTDRASHDVGRGFMDTPSLVGVGRTPPYLHDGSARTLDNVLTDWRGHGVTLPEAERKALGRYLDSL